MTRAGVVRIEAAQVHCAAVDRRTRWVMLELHAENGDCGLGEALLSDDDDLGLAALTLAGERTRGMEVSAAAPPLPTLAVEEASGLVEASAGAAVDQCLWDLRAQALSAPLHALLGPRRRTALRLYANINRGTRDRSPEGFADRAAEAIAAGYEAVKIAPFDGVTRGSAHTVGGRAALEMALARIAAVREAIGDNTLMVDCHCRLDLPAALRVLDTTAVLRIDWLEDALPYHDLAGWERLRAASDVTLAGGETARGVRDLLPFIERGIWDVLMPDVRFIGITGLKALDELTAQAQLVLAPHNPRGPVGTLASAHVMAVSGSFDALEFQFGECAWRSDLVGGAEQIASAMLRVPDAPGLGARLDRDVLARHVDGDVADGESGELRDCPGRS